MPVAPGLRLDLAPPGAHAVTGTVRVVGTAQFPQFRFVLAPLLGKGGQVVAVAEGAELPLWRSLSPRLYAIPANATLPADATTDTLAQMAAPASPRLHRPLWGQFFDPTSRVDTTVRIVAVTGQGIQIQRDEQRSFGHPAPFLVLGGLVLLLAWRVWRRRRAAVAPTAAPPAA